jgi:hypothetical protein
MTVASLRRLPGFRFEDRAPSRDLLPRMDVALFAGFAGRGPIHRPVAIEDVGQFQTVFGGLATLAFDIDRGAAVHAQLAPAVRMFFANGGRRCWVIRLAQAAKSNKFRVPGLLAPFALLARSPGSWADEVAVSASLTSERRAARLWRPATSILEILDTRTAPISPGDLLRLTWRDVGVEAYAGVKTTTVVDDAQAGSGRYRLRVEFGDQQWFDIAGPAAPNGTAELPSGLSVSASVETFATSPVAAGDKTLLDLDVAPEDAPRPGEVISASFGTDRLVLAVDDVMVVPVSGSPSGTVVRLRGRGLWNRKSALPNDLPVVERLTLDLWAREGDAPPRRLGNLGLAAGHLRHIGSMPDDCAVYGATDSLDVTQWSDAITPRFPIAGPGDSSLCIPFGVTTLPIHYLDADVPAGAPLERDGLAKFEPSLFIDEALANSLTATLQDDTDFLRFMARQVREPWGIHRALTVDEPSLIAVPDATQPGWEPMTPDFPLAPDPSASFAQDSCPKDDFIDCGAVLGKPPVLESKTDAGDAGVSLEWTAEPQAERFVLEESTSRDWRGTIEVFEGDADRITLPPRAPGDYYYRVRGVDAYPTEWSNGVAIRVAPGAGFRVRRASEYRDDVLLAVHRVLLRMCAARRNAMAVLSLPRHYDDGSVAEYVRRLSPVAVTSRADLEAEDRAAEHPGTVELNVPPLSGTETLALNFGALYDTWAYARDEGGEISNLAPDGLACGVIARRTNERGAWIAPANEALRGVVALAKSTSRERRERLQRSQVNVAAPGAAGFYLLSADTLSMDDDLRPISVRRLLILLHRLAIERGSTYVFEPNDDAFRRLVQRGFEALLGDLFQRGAFAGSTVDSAFQVVTGESLNTRQSIDQGRFIVELRVAPSRPLTFVTIRLVQTGERVSVTGA